MAKKRKGAKKAGRKVRVDLRKNRGKTARGKSELTSQYREETIKQEDAELSENVRAKGRLSRKRTIIVHDDATADAELLDGTVVALRGLLAEVDDGKRIWACTVRRMLRTRLIKERHPVAVGDAVRFRPVESAGRQRHAVSASRELAEGVVENVAERKTVLLRQYERRVHVVAANIDIAVIVMAADQPTLRPHLIDRYLVSAHTGEMLPVICINKMDLDADSFAAGVVERYTRLGYKSFGTSVISGVGLDSLREALRDQTSVLAGPSGVGKSSLLNILDPDLRLDVGSLTDLQRGKHTTTTARLLRWAFGGYVVDTPGLRQFDLTEIEPDALEAYFVEFVDLIQDCRFEDCSHTHEGDCEIQAAVNDGRIAPERYDSYCRMYAESVAKKQQRY